MKHYLIPVTLFYLEQSVQSLSHVQLFVNPWTAAHQASLSITNSQSLLKLMSIESVMPANHLIFCHPLLLLPSVFPSLSRPVAYLPYHGPTLSQKLYPSPHLKWHLLQQSPCSLTNLHLYLFP